MGGGVVLPNVSLCVKEDEVHYNPYDYSDRYFTTIAAEDGVISFNISSAHSTSLITSISYSTDEGETWTTTQNVDGRNSTLEINVNVSNGDRVLWKGIAQGFSEDGYENSFFSSTCLMDVEGNIMSLLYGDDFIGQKSLNGRNLAFYALFYDYWDGVKATKVRDAYNLCLPATTLSNKCYMNMFYSCTTLLRAPRILPAETLSSSCYANMFQDCTALTTTPKLPATTLATSCYSFMFANCKAFTDLSDFRLPAMVMQESCYNGMFTGCVNLLTAPNLPSTNLARRCYSNMFNGCSSLVNAPQLPATNLEQQCYEWMFSQCNNLKNAPMLPATNLADRCYSRMFWYCSSLEQTPQLPATTLIDMCYYSMFAQCVNLKTASPLPASVLAFGCYSEMFNGCSSLNEIEMLATDISASNCLQNWVRGVNANGTFKKKQGVNIPSGNSGIPNNWTVVEVSE